MPSNHFLEISPVFPVGSKHPPLPHRSVKIGFKALEVARDAREEGPVLWAVRVTDPSRIEVEGARILIEQWRGTTKCSSAFHGVTYWSPAPAGRAWPTLAHLPRVALELAVSPNVGAEQSVGAGQKVLH